MIRDVQELYKYRECKDYVTKLLFIFSPTSRLVDYHHHELELRKKPSMLKGKSLPHLPLKSSMPRLNSSGDYDTDDDAIISRKSSMVLELLPATKILF